MQDPYSTQVDTANLSALTQALELLATHADLNHRYRTMLDESRELLGTDRIRLTQARGLAKRLMVLIKAAGEQWRAQLPPDALAQLEEGETQAHDLVFHPEEA